MDRAPLNVLEVTIPLTPAMREIHSALLELIDTCLFELRRANPTVRRARRLLTVQDPTLG